MKAQLPQKQCSSGVAVHVIFIVLCEKNTLTLNHVFDPGNFGQNNILSELKHLTGAVFWSFPGQKNQK